MDSDISPPNQAGYLIVIHKTVVAYSKCLWTQTLFSDASIRPPIRPAYYFYLYLVLLNKKTLTISASTFQNLSRSSVLFVLYPGGGVSSEGG